MSPTACFFSTIEVEVFQLVNKSLANATTTTAAPTSPIPKEDITSSTILNSEEIQKIYELAQFSPNQSLQLLYRASRDTFMAFAFHTKCDNYLNTLSIIKSTNGYVFAGFTTQSWTCCNCYKVDPSAFILSLRRNTPAFNTATHARRFNVTDSSKAIYALSHYGPSFGGGRDLLIDSMSNIYNYTYSRFGRSYQYPIEFDAMSFNASNYLTGCTLIQNGTCRFNTVEIEVFQLVNKSAPKQQLKN